MQNDLQSIDCARPTWDILTIYQFHADNLSSAHLYLRLKENETWDNIPDDLLEDCAQLTKANSIEGRETVPRRIQIPANISALGNKKDNVTIIYTPWSNLLKSASMATGQVSFRNPKLTRKVLVPARQNHIVNRLNKTRVEKFPDLMAEKEEVLKAKRKAERKLRDEKRAEEKREKRERAELKWQKEHAYDDMMNEENIQQSSNQNRDEDFLDDFM